MGAKKLRCWPKQTETIAWVATLAPRSRADRNDHSKTKHICVRLIFTRPLTRWHKNASKSHRTSRIKATQQFISKYFSDSALHCKAGRQFVTCHVSSEFLHPHRFAVPHQIITSEIQQRSNKCYRRSGFRLQDEVAAKQMAHQPRSNTLNFWQKIWVRCYELLMVSRPSAILFRSW